MLAYNVKVLAYHVEEEKQGVTTTAACVKEAFCMPCNTWSFTRFNGGDAKSVMDFQLSSLPAWLVTAKLDF